MTTILWWIRRDLRLHDHPALEYALQKGRVIPVFILDDRLLQKEASKRKQFLFSGLRQLDEDLRKRGSQLIIRRGEPLAELTRLIQETGAEEIVALEDYSPYARRRDSHIARELPLHLFAGETVYPPSLVLKPDGSPYTVFTPFSRAWKALPFASPSVVSLPERFPAVPDKLVSLPIPEAIFLQDFPPGELEALRRLENFLSGPAREYADGRNRLDQDRKSVV